MRDHDGRLDWSFSLEAKTRGYNMGFKLEAKYTRFSDVLDMGMRERGVSNSC